MRTEKLKDPRSIRATKVLDALMERKVLHFYKNPKHLSISR